MDINDSPPYDTALEAMEQQVQDRTFLLFHTVLAEGFLQYIDVMN